MKIFEGKVISTKMTKSAVVLVENKYRHPVYGKIMKRKKKIHASNELGASVGQTVRIIETRPISKTISFKISEIIGEDKSKENSQAEKENVDVKEKDKKTSVKVKKENKKELKE